MRPTHMAVVALGATVVVLVGAGAMSRRLDVGPLARDRPVVPAQSIAVSTSGASPALRASTRRLVLTVDLHAACASATAPQIVAASAEETATAVTVTVTVRAGGRTHGPCAGVRLVRSRTVTLRRPLGLRRVYNPDGRVKLTHVDPRSLTAAGGRGQRYALAAAPVVVRGRGSGAPVRPSDLDVYVRLRRPLPTGAPLPRIRLDASRATARATPVADARRCLRATVDGSGDRGRAPQLDDARGGQRTVVRVQPGAPRRAVWGTAHIVDARARHRTPGQLERSFLSSLGC